MANFCKRSKRSLLSVKPLNLAKAVMKLIMKILNVNLYQTGSCNACPIIKNKFVIDNAKLFPKINFV